MTLKTRTVYIISSALTPKVYIGSTSCLLTSRLSRHEDNSKSNFRKCKSCEIIKLGEYKISPLCVVDNCTKKEIELKENDYIFCFKDICVNKLGTKDSYSKDYHKLYDEKRKERRAKKILCECGGSYNIQTKVRHFKTKKHLNFSNLII